MKFLRKNLILFIFSISSLAHAQQKSSSVNSASLQTCIQKIVADYPNEFNNIKGEVINENPQSIEYESLLIPEGADAPIITKYSAKKKPFYSWQAVMLSTEDFEEAAKKYKSVFNQLKGVNVVFNAGSNFYLQGTFEEADESKKFTSSILNFLTRQAPMNKLKIEVNLQYEFPEWKVNLLVYERERADDERGNIYDN